MDDAASAHFGSSRDGEGVFSRFGIVLNALGHFLGSVPRVAQGWWLVQEREKERRQLERLLFCHNTSVGAVLSAPPGGRCTFIEKWVSSRLTAGALSLSLMSFCHTNMGSASSVIARPSLEKGSAVRGARAVRCSLVRQHEVHSVKWTILLCDALLGMIEGRIGILNPLIRSWQYSIATFIVLE